jgi:hypothetical protein
MELLLAVAGVAIGVYFVITGGLAIMGGGKTIVKVIRKQ